MIHWCSSKKKILAWESVLRPGKAEGVEFTEGISYTTGSYGLSLSDLLPPNAFAAKDEGECQLKDVYLCMSLTEPLEERARFGFTKKSAETFFTKLKDAQPTIQPTLSVACT